MSDSSFRRPGSSQLASFQRVRRRRRFVTGVEALEDRQVMAVMSPLGITAAALKPTLAPQEVAPRIDTPATNTRLDPALATFSQELLADQPPANSNLAFLLDDAGRVGVTVTSWDVARLLPKLGALGFQTMYDSAELHTIEGFAPVTALNAMAGMNADGLLGILPIYRPGSAVGAVTSQADFVLEADRVRQTPVTGVNGSGVRVGILSDSFNRLNGYSTDIATGDLPSNVNVVREGPAGSADEGRGMAQLVYDLAPGSGLAFASAFYGEGAFGNSIRDLANPAIGNSGVITDDIFYFEEPQFQDGLIAQAINDVTANRNVAYFALAGNLGNNAYESTSIQFATDSYYAGNGANFFDFDPGAGVDTRQRITVAAGQSITLNLQWDNPFFTTNGVTTDLDFYLINPTTNAIVAGSVRSNMSTQTPSEIFTYTNTNIKTITNDGAQAFDLAIVRVAGTPGRIKWVNYGANNYGAVTVNEFNTNSPTVIPHSAAAGGVSVAAAPFFNQLSPESYTSLGPFTALFSANGTRLATPDVRQGPDITAIDGTDTTFFGSDFDGNGVRNFFGTSAAAPHAAAVGALIRAANPALSPSQVYNRMITTATDIVDTSQGAGIGTDNKTGAGLINAYRAIYGPAVASTLPVRDGFETSALSNIWETYNTGGARTVVTSANSPATGTYQLKMDGSLDSSRFQGFGLNEATLRIDPTGATGDVYLAFREKEFNDADNPMPATFTNHGNYDGVALSVDGVNWYRLVSLTGTASTNSFGNYLYNLSAVAAANGLTLGANTRVRFQHYTISPNPVGGFAFDDVRVATVAPVVDVVVNDGNIQRSVVRQINIDIAGIVTSATATSFQITRAQDGATFTPTATVISTGPNSSRIRLTFSGGDTEFGSLADGDYTLSINGTAILDDLGVAVDGDANGTAGGNRSLAFFRLFGDTDGDRDVDGTDFELFRQAYLGLIPLVTYLDFNNSGSIVNDSADRTAFLARRGKKLTSAGVVFA